MANARGMTNAINETKASTWEQYIEIGEITRNVYYLSFVSMAAAKTKHSDIPRPT